ncbi:MAG: glycogen-binding domain-containing protein [Elusimicrobiota bacterium]|jgi:hypothetical protein
MTMDASLRGKFFFWFAALAVFLLAAVPSLVIVDKTREYYRFVTGWQPETLKMGSIRRLPPSGGLDERSLPDFRFVEFKFPSPHARAVRLAGSFNRWQAETLTLIKREGAWRVTLPLAPGTYTYAFEVDGVLTRDPASADKTLFEGREVSVLHVR